MWGTFPVKHIDPDEKMTFAYLNKDQVPVLCSWYEWKEWWKREGDRCHLRAETKASWQTTPRNAIKKGKTASRAPENIRIRNLPAFEMDFRQK